VERTIFSDEHTDFRQMVRDFLEKEAVPHHPEWEKQGQVSRDIWLAAGKTGLLAMDVPEEYGGGGSPDLRFQWVVTEEVARAGTSGLGFTLHNDVVAPYLIELTTEEQKQRWLPRFCTGELISAIAMTEPGTGSDLQGIQTRAVREGDEWVINGQKTFITNGILGDLAPTASASSSSSATPPASSGAATSRRSGCRPRTPRSCRSPTSACPRRTCSARRARASST
jgi:alkylation response protein AidB-like acyl-CoA dehydrogenase